MGGRLEVARVPEDSEISPTTKFFFQILLVHDTLIVIGEPVGLRHVHEHVGGGHNRSEEEPVPLEVASVTIFLEVPLGPRWPGGLHNGAINKTSRALKFGRNRCIIRPSRIGANSFAVIV